jgi:thiamine biosynthesis lipoprotein
MRRHDFRSMGTDVVLLADDACDPDAFARAAARVMQVFAREDARSSRFRGDSELSLVNASAGRWTQVSPTFADVARLALDAAARTEGRFDPTILPALLAAGYDRDFDDVIAGARRRLHPARPCGRWRDVHLAGRWLRLPDDVMLDLGGLVKGWTVDVAALEAVACGLPWALVNAGGDLRIAGEPPTGGVAVAIEDPSSASRAELGRVALDGGALATSSVTRRSWGPALHHLIDPRTGRPADTGVVQATAWAPTCAEAEVRSKVALLDGERALASFTATIVHDDGTVVTNLPPAGAEVAA